MLKNMEKGIRVVWVLSMALAFLLFGPSQSLAASQKLVSIAATGAASSYYIYHVAISQLLNKNVPEIRVSVLETGASVDNLRRIEKGEADFGQFSDPDLYESYKGLGPSEGKPHPNMRLYWLVHPLAYMIVVNKDSGVKTLKDLNGKKICPGARGSITEMMTEFLFNIIGVKPEYFRAGFADAVAAMKDRRIVGYVKSGPINAPDATVLDVATAIPVALLSFNKEEVKKVQAVYPHYDFITVPAGLYKGVGDFTARASFFCVGGTKNLDANIVYKIVKTVCENVDYQATSYPAAKGGNIADFTVKYGQAPLHSGSLKYFRELGHKVPDRLIPPEGK